MDLLDLPTEMTLYICDLLPKSSRVSMSYVNKYLNNTIPFTRYNKLIANPINPNNEAQIRAELTDLYFRLNYDHKYSGVFYDMGVLFGDTVIYFTRGIICIENLNNLSYGRELFIKQSDIINIVKYENSILVVARNLICEICANKTILIK